MCWIPLKRNICRAARANGALSDASSGSPDINHNATFQDVVHRLLSVRLHMNNCTVFFVGLHRKGHGPEQTACMWQGIWKVSHIMSSYSSSMHWNKVLQHTGSPHWAVLKLHVKAHQHAHAHALQLAAEGGNCSLPGIGKLNIASLYSVPTALSGA